MRIKVFYGSTTKDLDFLYFDDIEPLEQVKKVEWMIEQNIDFSVLSYSPYVIEAIDGYVEHKKKNEDVKVSYFLNGIKSDCSSILSRISEAFHRIQDYQEN